MDCAITKTVTGAKAIHVSRGDLTDDVVDLYVLSAVTIMASFAYGTRSSNSRRTRVTVIPSRPGPKVSSQTRNITFPCDSARLSSGTVFDLLYSSYLPFRLYADYMLGSSPAELATQFGLPEDWVTERIEAVRLCGKQVRLNLLDSAPRSNTV